MNTFALILAGGSGERFWPLSRRSRPKQLLSLFSNTTLLEQTLERLEGLVPKENILILTNRDQEAAVRKLITSLPAENIVAEPAKRDTAAAIALGAGWVSRRDQGATMIVLPADHLIQDKAAFQQTLRTACDAAQNGDLVTVGITPTWPCPGFGYIETGREVSPGVSEVKRFREKPSPDLAARFLREGNYRWNAGMFVWTIPAILSALDRHAPELAAFIQRLHGAGDLPAFLDKEFPSLPKISVDYAIMEKAERVLVVEATFDWDDMGSWLALATYLDSRDHENRANTPLTAIDAGNNIVYSDSPRQVVMLGVHDLIVVQTSDALLVCHRGEAEKIKDAVRVLPPELQ